VIYFQNKFLLRRKITDAAMATTATIPMATYSHGNGGTGEVTENAQVAVRELPWVSFTVSSMSWLPGCIVVEYVMYIDVALHPDVTNTPSTLSAIEDKSMAILSVYDALIETDPLDTELPLAGARLLINGGVMSRGGATPKAYNFPSTEPMYTMPLHIAGEDTTFPPVV
jgi:hypothetical protein